MSESESFVEKLQRLDLLESSLLDMVDEIDGARSKLDTVDSIVKNMERYDEAETIVGVFAAKLREALND